MSQRFPAVSVPGAAELAPRQRRRFRVDRLPGRLAPYALILPAGVAIATVLGYPVYLLVRLSFEKYDLPQVIGVHDPVWIGLANYSKILGDSEFWRVVGRTVVFTAVNVSLTMVLGTLLALLLAALGRWMRLLLTTGLVLIWAMPVVVSVNIWLWMVDYEFGVANWVLDHLGLHQFRHHDWFVNPWSGFAVITAVIVWGALPFVAITIYAGLTQVPGELVEAAEIDGAGRWRVFRDITFPILKPIFIILTSLSIIWDFQVFNQVWLMRNQGPSSDYYLMAVYSYVQSFGISHYGLGSAIAVVMVLAMLVVSFVYVRQMVRIGEVR
jgi:N,N'-diacetylchitobiose transport system permease protein